MFRCITEIKGIAFDIDSFDEDEFAILARDFSIYEIVLLTSDPEIQEKLVPYFNPSQIFTMERIQRYLAPNKSTHTKVLSMLGVKASEMIYVSKRHSFLVNAMCFMGGTAWITDRITYQDISVSPDLICRRLETLHSYLEMGVYGFYGEVTLYPADKIRKGLIIPVEFAVEGKPFLMYVIGRYYGYTQYMSQLHPYSSIIYINKKQSGKCYGIFNNDIESLLLKAVQRVMHNHEVGGICAVPSRPNQPDRFSEIVNNIAIACGIVDYTSDFKCIKNYPNQKGLQSNDRIENVRDVFSFDKKLNGENIILIDDVVTTGATITECTKMINRAGAGSVFPVVLGVNQRCGDYWSSNTIIVSCPRCGEKMFLSANSTTKELFYSCFNCGKTISYKDGRTSIKKWMNEEFMDV